MNIIGGIGEDTFVGWCGAHAWTVNIYEVHHSMTELDEKDVDRLIRLLKQARRIMVAEKEKYMLNKENTQ